VKSRRLVTIPGNAVSPLDVPTGCAFAPRCQYRMEICDQRPALRGANDHVDACWLSDEQRLAIRSTATLRGES
jgi:peptide/nickel transport system ATP-binding protein